LGLAELQRQKKIQEAYQPRVRPNSVLVREVPNNKRRNLVIGWDSGADVLAGDTFQITTRPQLPFRGERVAVPSDLAGYFAITDIKVGNKSQFVAQGRIHSRTLSEQAVGVRMLLDTGNTSQDLIVLVENISGTDALFMASVFGTAADT
jgi:hypothetical protein